jgi:hypothetical protein
MGYPCEVDETAEPADTNQPARPQQPAEPDPAVIIQQTVHQALLTITLPDDYPVLGPDPAGNEWNAIPVNYPIWLWTTNHTTTTIHQTLQQDGISISITANRLKTVFDLGDGTTITCHQMSERAKHLPDPLTPSPTCGHTYTTMNNYPITATSYWAITWQAQGHNGNTTITTTHQRPEPLTIMQIWAQPIYNPNNYPT